MADEPKKLLGFRPVKMPDWWDKEGRIFIMGGVVCLAHPDHAPVILNNRGDGWDVMPTQWGLGTVFAMDDGSLHRKG